jgi:hypothetical protein
MSTGEVVKRRIAMVLLNVGLRKYSVSGRPRP